jgi:hypothetical protein
VIGGDGDRRLEKRNRSLESGDFCRRAVDLDFYRTGRTELRHLSRALTESVDDFR